MNIVYCTINNNPNAKFISLEYIHKNETYTLEIPKTKHNEFLIDGKTIEVNIGLSLNESQVDAYVEQERK